MTSERITILKSPQVFWTVNIELRLKLIQ